MTPINFFTWSYRSENIFREIVVPTCSYRMGVPEMAFGLATFQMDGARITMTYRNLWLPSRFPLLITYAVTLPLSLLLFLMGRRRAVQYKRPRSRRASHNYPDYSKHV